MLGYLDYLYQAFNVNLKVLLTFILQFIGSLQYANHPIIIGVELRCELSSLSCETSHFGEVNMHRAEHLLHGYLVRWLGNFPI